MKDLNCFTAIYLALDHVDFRKQIHGLASIVRASLDKNPLTDKSVFVFTNKRKNAIRILYWDSTGFALWSKVLEKERFRWPKSKGNSSIKISSKEAKWLLQGIDITKLKKHEKLSFDELL